jgi:Heavy-metal resistance
MKPLVSWMLGGALLASLSWNWQLRCEHASSCSPTAESACQLDSACLGLDPALREKLSSMCAETCGAADELDRRADELQASLLRALAEPSVDRTATAKLIGEVAELRKRALEECVEGVLGVREVLGADEVRALVERCSVQSGR